jgi:ATP synthase protein I
LKDENKSILKSVGKYSAIGIEIAVSVIIGLFIGSYLDGLFDTSPWLTIIFLIFGFVAGMRSLFTLMKEEEKRDS